MAIAITPFDGLCGFRPLAEITHFLSSVPSLRKTVGESAASRFETSVRGKETSENEHDTMKNKEALKTCFTALMKASPETIKSSAKELVASAEKDGEAFAAGGSTSNEGSELAKVILRLNSQFPDDIGLFVFFFLNYIKMEPGEGMFLKADDIHAYLSGGKTRFNLYIKSSLIWAPDIIECMASSDNVVRAGFTPKFKDVDTLTSMLTYSYAPISEQKMSPSDYPYATLSAAAYSSNSSAILYDPPIDEFSVVKTDLRREGAKVTMDGIEGPSIVICTEGEGTIGVGPKKEEVKPGYVFFVGATAELVLESSSATPYVTFKAFCELKSKGPATNGH